jgi:hypothetical protein
VNIGQTVFYRLDDDDIEAVRRLRRGVTTFDNEGFAFAEAVNLLYGSEIKEGDLLPAEVVACYTVEEAVLKLHQDDVDNLYDAEDRRQPHITFSGFADIRVKLPGNDILWLPWAQQDRQCKAVQGRGHGTTALPQKGLFTTSVPAELL